MDKYLRDEILGIISLLLSVFIIITLLSHNPWDPSPFTLSSGARIKNLGGIVGAYLSDSLLQGFGIGTYIIPVFFIIYGVKRILGKQRGKAWFRLLSSLALLLSVCLLFSLTSRNFLVFNHEFPGGGMLGYAASRLFQHYLSITGAYIISAAIFIVALMVSIPLSVVTTAKDIKKKVAEKKAPEPNMGPEILEHTIVRPVRRAIEEPTEHKEPMQLPPKVRGSYSLPSIELLQLPQQSKGGPTKEELLMSSSILEKKLQDFGVDGRVLQVHPGPVVTMFEYEPAPGVKMHRIISLCDDLALAMKASSLRVSPIPGKAVIGIEIPNREREDVYLREIIASEAYKKSVSKLTFALGKDIFGNPVLTDLTKMPHLLVAGATGSGKSVAINVMVLSLLFRAHPKEVKMLMIDPKLLELSTYEDIPHLINPVITNPKEAAEALRKMVFEMERRYRLLAEKGARNIEGYNRSLKSGEEPMPYIVVFIDELADLMLVGAHEIEDSIARLAQMARASGIHLILATQRPSVDVITGVIKANFPARLSFQVSSKIDSRTILDTQGAEHLLGKGDMLFMSPGTRLVRIHGAYVTEDEIRAVVDFIKPQASPDYTYLNAIQVQPREEDAPSDERDELYQGVVEFATIAGEISISSIQRRFNIGYNKAARIMEIMEEDGLVGPPTAAGKKREVLRRKR